LSTVRETANGRHGVLVAAGPASVPASVPRRKRAFLRLGACAWTAIEAIHHETDSSPATAQSFEQRQQEELDRRNRKADGMRKEREQGNWVSAPAPRQLRGNSMVPSTVRTAEQRHASFNRSRGKLYRGKLYAAL
jgi:hypothetical protein